MDLDTPNSFDHYDIYFQDDTERYMRGFEAYEQFLALSNQEVGGSGSGSAKKKRTYIPREREEVEQRLIDDYFGDDDALPKYTEEYFRRMYRVFTFSQLRSIDFRNNIWGRMIQKLFDLQHQLTRTEEISAGYALVSTISSLSQLDWKYASSEFGEQHKLAPMADDRKIRWKRGVGWLLSVTHYIVELVPSQQTSKGNDVVQRSDKWWLPTVKVPHEGLSEDSENGCSIKKIVSFKFLSYQSKNTCRDGDS
ncbi:putative membrane lipoprotein [Tanacetum coccineum]